MLPVSIQGSTSCWPMFELASPTMAVSAPMARAIGGGAMTIPVRVPGKPSLERLSVRMVCGAQ